MAMRSWNSKSRSKSQTSPLPLRRLRRSKSIKLYKIINCNDSGPVYTMGFLDLKFFNIAVVFAIRLDTCYASCLKYWLQCYLGLKYLLIMFATGIMVQPVSQINLKFWLTFYCCLISNWALQCRACHCWPLTLYYQAPSMDPGSTTQSSKILTLA